MSESKLVDVFLAMRRLLQEKERFERKREMESKTGATVVSRGFYAKRKLEIEVCLCVHMCNACPKD
jgi:hypothetical protein